MEARDHARVPYSRFPVGAALLTRSGRIFKGCNIENISLRLTLCAEEVAVGNAVVSGDTEFVAVAVVADSQQPIMQKIEATVGGDQFFAGGAQLGRTILELLEINDLFVHAGGTTN